MKLNIDEFENIPENFITYEFHEIIKRLENDRMADGSITVYKTGYGVRIEGHIETDIELQCDRCLDVYTYRVNINIDENFIEGTIGSDSTKEYELTQGEFVEELNGRKEIDITDLIYQSIIIDLPGKKLCRAECKGSKEFQSIHAEDEIDPRMEIFKKISVNDKNENKAN